LAAGSAIWVASFGLEYVAVLKRLHSTPALLAYWQTGFAPRPLGLDSTFRWIYRTGDAVTRFPWHLGLPVLTFALLVVGEIVLLRRRQWIGVLVVVLGAVMLVAAVARQYPITDRMVLFTVPFACLLLGAAVVFGRSVASRLVMLAAVVVVTAPALDMASVAVARPYTRTEVRAAYLYVLHHERPGDVVLVEWEGGPDYDYYHETLGVTAIGSFQLAGSPDACDNTGQLAPLRRHGRVWFVFAIDPGRESHRPIPQYRAALASLGTVHEDFRSPGNAGAFLITPTHAAPRHAAAVRAPTWQPDRYGCLTVTLIPPSVPAG
jgi:hypothetical protein